MNLTTEEFVSPVEDAEQVGVYREFNFQGADGSKVHIKWYPLKSNPKRLLDDVESQALVRLWPEEQVAGFKGGLASAAIQMCYAALMNECAMIEKQAMEEASVPRPEINPDLLVVDK